MVKLSYYVEPCAELELALTEIRERLLCFADWMPLEDCIVVVVECFEEEVNFVKDLLAPFV